MTDQANNKMNKLVVYLVLFLLFATVAQGFFLFWLYKGNQQPEQHVTNSRSLKLFPQPQDKHPPAAPPDGGPGSLGPSDPLGIFGNDPHGDPWGWNQNDWDPFLEFQRMQKRMNHLFNDSFSRFRLSPGFNHERSELSFSPRLDLKEEDDRFVIRMDVPGAEKSNLSVKIEDRQLIITGKVDETIEEKDRDQILRKERRSGQLRRSLTLPGPVDSEAMTAKYDHGVLTIIVPKGKETKQSKTVTVK